jgi:hypothetical protein
MADEKAKPPLRFGIRTLLVLMALVALLLTLAPKIHQRIYYTPLSEAIKELNAYYSVSLPAAHEAQIVGAIRQVLRNPGLSEEVTDALTRIERTHSLPSTARLRMYPMRRPEVYLDIRELNYILSISDSHGWHYWSP